MTRHSNDADLVETPDRPSDNLSVQILPSVVLPHWRGPETRAIF
jgi:hypothetical protein